MAASVLTQRCWRTANLARRRGEPWPPADVVVNLGEPPIEEPARFDRISRSSAMPKPIAKRPRALAALVTLGLKPERPVRRPASSSRRDAAAAHERPLRNRSACPLTEVISNPAAEPPAAAAAQPSAAA